MSSRSSVEAFCLNDSQPVGTTIQEAGNGCRNRADLTDCISLVGAGDAPAAFLAANVPSCGDGTDPADLTNPHATPATWKCP